MKTLNSWSSGEAAALLTVARLVSAQTPPGLDMRLFAGVNIAGTMGSVYVVQSASNIALSNSWMRLAFLQLPGTNCLFVDTSGPTRGNRFYRALLQTPPDPHGVHPPQHV
jgi:hypothetical protein